jgi:hypothetical protein
MNASLLDHYIWIAAGAVLVAVVVAIVAGTMGVIDAH